LHMFATHHCLIPVDEQSVLIQIWILFEDKIFKIKKMDSHVLLSLFVLLKGLKNNSII
jgi:hypothetical protein